MRHLFVAALMFGIGVVFTLVMASVVQTWAEAKKPQDDGSPFIVTISEPHPVNTGRQRINEARQPEPRNDCLPLPQPTPFSRPSQSMPLEKRL
ncbi:MAG TPA: hypothetical protein VMI56_21940 [Reyranella sp.]|nr:hypothetical protein [Reyranella sp.]